MSRRRALPRSGLCAAILAGCVSVASAQMIAPDRVVDPAADVPVAEAALQRPAAGAAADDGVPGFRELLRSLGGDLRQLSKVENLGLIGIGALGAIAAHPFDDEIQDAAWGEGRLHDFLSPGKDIGGFYAQTGGAFATYAIGRVTGSDRVAEVGAELVRAQMLTQVTTQFVKLTTTRTRPDGTSLSFPSGHSGGAFATATVLQRNFGWKAGAPAYAMAAWVAASRVQMKRHHLSDVIVGATVGILAGRAVTIGRGDNTFAVTPTVVPGGAGVSFTRISR
jgi:hypothetical protein